MEQVIHIVPDGETTVDGRGVLWLARIDDLYTDDPAKLATIKNEAAVRGMDQTYLVVEMQPTLGPSFAVIDNASGQCVNIKISGRVRFCKQTTVPGTLIVDDQGVEIGTPESLEMRTLHAGDPFTVNVECWLT